MDRYCTHCRSGTHWTHECPSFAPQGTPARHQFAGSAVEGAAKLAAQQQAHREGRDLKWSPPAMPRLPDERRRHALHTLIIETRRKTTSPEVFTLCDAFEATLQAINMAAKGVTPALRQQLAAGSGAAQAATKPQQTTLQAPPNPVAVAPEGVADVAAPSATSDNSNVTALSSTERSRRRRQKLRAQKSGQEVSKNKAGG